MTKKNTISLVILGIVVVGVGAYLLSQQTSLQKGTVAFGVTDAAGSMGDVSSVLVTINKVDVHDATSGWVTVSNETKQYDLLVLKQSGAVSLLASSSVAVGTYDQVRLMISKVIVVKSGVRVEAKLPSGELKIIGNIVVNADKTTSMVFDFMADKSLHTTGNGKLIFAPVIKIQKRTDAQVELKSNDEIDITGGKEENDENVGMDEKGEVRNNFELKGNLNIDENDDIQGENDDNNNNQSGGNNEGKAETKDDLVFNFNAQNNSGLSGTATLSEEDGDVKVSLKLKSSVSGLLTSVEPAHIHFGSCANIGGVKYPLDSVVSGKSETTLNVSLAELKAGLPLAINVHKSVAESSIYSACTDLKF